jgi:hypothetical protein
MAQITLGALTTLNLSTHLDAMFSDLYGYSKNVISDASGNAMFGGKAAAGITGAGAYFEPASGIQYGRLNFIKESGSGTGATTAVGFYYSGSAIGSIQCTNVATSYATSSDYRLKNISGPIHDSGPFIDALRPCVGTWKIDGSAFVGFLAHEVQQVSPSSVVGIKDAVDQSGAPILQSMAYGSAEFVANIVAELQSLRARVAALGG